MTTLPRKFLSIQVKGSKAYEPTEKQSKENGEGSNGWFFFPKDVIEQSTVDYFIFLVYVIEQSSATGRRTIKPYTITIPTKRLNDLVRVNKTQDSNGKYHFYFWVNPKEKEAFDWRNKEKNIRYDVSDYLDEKGIEKLNQSLR